MNGADPERRRYEDDSGVENHGSFDHRHQESNPDKPQSDEETLCDEEANGHRIGEVVFAFTASRLGTCRFGTGFDSGGGAGDLGEHICDVGGEAKETYPSSG